MLHRSSGFLVVDPLGIEHYTVLESPISLCFIFIHIKESSSRATKPQLKPRVKSVRIN